jgi:AcrR family transcriptional regulator
MGVQPSTSRGIATRQRIVDAAARVVAEKGAVGASLDEVGERASASRSQLYHYFEDKADLLRAVAEATNDAVLDGQRDLFADLGSWDGLARWADALVALQVQYGGRGGCPIANLVGQLGERDDDIRAVLASGFDRWEACIRDGLAEMIASGELRPDTDADWLATSTLASLQGGLTLTQARRDPQALRRALDGALALIATYRPGVHLSDVRDATVGRRLAPRDVSIRGRRSPPTAAG